MPLVSVIMTTYNENEKFLIQCIESILNQTFQDFEFIIVFEPNEQNKVILENYAKNDLRVKLIENKEKQGFVKSLNIGLSKSLGKYIVRIDADDYCDVKRLEVQYKFLENNKDIDVVGSHMNIIDSNNNLLSTRYYQLNYKLIKKNFLFSNAMAHPTVMIRRQCLKKYGFYNESFLMSEDLELWLRLLSHNILMANIDKPLVYYRQPDNVLEKRQRKNWIYNYKARILHSRKIWNFPMTYVSFIIIKILVLIPEKLLNIIYNSNFVKKYRGVKE